MTFYSPLGLLFLLTIPIIILLYLLKQKHRDYTVSSLYLWSAVLKDLEANAPWQKLKKNLLMFLQIAAMALLALAIAKPFLDVDSGRSDYAVIAIDSSLSMQATDTSPSRFEAARKEASRIVSNLKPGTSVTLITMGSNAVIEENLSRDKSSLLNRISKLEATNASADFDEAAALIESIAKQQPGSVVYLLGDTALTIPGTDLRFYDYSNSGSNHAVTLLSHTSTSKGITVLSRIANYSAGESVIPVSLYTDGRVFDAKNVSAAPGETVNVYWNDIPVGTLSLECRIDAKDALAADNSAWDAVNPSKESKVLLASSKNIFIEKALSVMEGIKLYKTSPDAKQEFKGYDLYILDGFMPDKLPVDGNLIVFDPPSNSYFTVEGETATPTLKHSNHRLFNYIDSSTFSISKTAGMTIPPWGESILESKEGPVIFAGQLQNRRLIVFGFDLHNSDLALTPAFPILMTNCLEWLIPSRIRNTENAFPGQGMEFNLNPKARSVQVKSPSGELTPLAPPFPARIFDNTQALGLYTLEQKMPGSQSLHYFTVNAPCATESNLQAGTGNVDTGSVNTGNSGTRANSGSNIKKHPPADTGFNLQSLLLWIVLLLLIIEWWVYKNEA